METRSVESRLTDLEENVRSLQSDMQIMKKKMVRLLKLKGIDLPAVNEKIEVKEEEVEKIVKSCSRLDRESESTHSISSSKSSRNNSEASPPRLQPLTLSIPLPLSTPLSPSMSPSQVSAIVPEIVCIHYHRRPCQPSKGAIQSDARVRSWLKPKKESIKSKAVPEEINGPKSMMGLNQTTEFTLDHNTSAKRIHFWWGDFHRKRPSPLPPPPLSPTPSPFSEPLHVLTLLDPSSLLRESLNAPGCDAIYITEMEADIDCDIFIPAIDAPEFQPWYLSFPRVENRLCYCFTTYVRVRNSAVEAPIKTNGWRSDSSDSVKFGVRVFSNLPKPIFVKHQEYLYLRRVEDRMSNGALREDRTETGTLSKFGCQMRFNLRKSFPLLTIKKVHLRYVQINPKASLTNSDWMELPSASNNTTNSGNRRGPRVLGLSKDGNRRVESGSDWLAMEKKRTQVVQNRSVGYASGTLYVLDLDGNLLGEWVAHDSPIIDMAAGPGYIVTLANDGGIHGWSITYPGSLDSILCSEISGKEPQYTRLENFKIVAGTWKIAQGRATHDSREVEMGAGFIAMSAARETMKVGLEGSAGQWWLDMFGKNLDKGSSFHRLGSSQLAGMLIGVWDRNKIRGIVGDIEVATDSAAALLFRILSQPALLFPPLRQVEGVEVQHEPNGGYVTSHKKQRQMPAAEATIEATAQGIASMLCAHGPEVEWRICTIWEAAYGLIPLSSSVIDLPEIIVATPLQPPILSWNLYMPLLKVLEYLPRGSPSEACLMKIFVATVEAILQRTFPAESSFEQTRKTRYVFGSASKNLAVAELRTMVHSLFLESCATVELSSRLLFVILTVCVSHEAQLHVGKKPRGEDSFPHVNASEELVPLSGKQGNLGAKRMNKQGPVAAFDSYVLAAVCALACELQLFPLISRTSNHSNLEDAQDVAKPAKAVKSSNGLQDSIDSAVSHTRRILAILEALFSLKPSSVGTSWSYSSNEIVAAAMVAAHISELFRRSKACMHALSVLMRCKWDKQIHSTATSLYNLIDIHSKAVASIVNKAEPLDAHLLQAPIWKDALVCLNGKRQNNCANASCSETGQSSTMQFDDPVTARTLVTSEEVSKLCGDSDRSSEKGITSFPSNASELANFLTMDRHIGFNCSARILLRSVLTEKQELCFSVVSLLWHKMIASPETQLSAESTSAQQGWRQVVDALCNVVSASPTTAATAIVLQAERELQPWIAKDDDLGQKMWRINQRIVKLIVELMRNHDTPKSLVILASALDLLLRATDGMLVDGEACTLPQLELLEATARAVHPVLEWGESGLAVADGLSNLLKCRLPATVRCLSHPSAHVRTLSISVLRAILHVGSIKPSSEQVNVSSNLGANIIDWDSDLGKCLTWEAHSRLATGMPIEYLDTAAKELGCPISI